MVSGGSPCRNCYCRSQFIPFQDHDLESSRQGLLDNCLRFEPVRIRYRLPIQVIISKHITSFAIQFKLIDPPIWYLWLTGSLANHDEIPGFLILESCRSPTSVGVLICLLAIYYQPPGSSLTGLGILSFGSPQANAVAPYYSKLCFTPESHDLAATSCAGDLLALVWN